MPVFHFRRDFYYITGFKYLYLFAAFLISSFSCSNNQNLSS